MFLQMQYINTQNPISIIATFSLNFKLSNGDECLWDLLFGSIIRKHKTINIM